MSNWFITQQHTGTEKIEQKGVVLYLTVILSQHEVQQGVFIHQSNELVTNYTFTFMHLANSVIRIDLHCIPGLKTNTEHTLCTLP